MFLSQLWSGVLLDTLLPNSCLLWSDACLSALEPTDIRIGQTVLLLVRSQSGNRVLTKWVSPYSELIGAHSLLADVSGGLIWARLGLRSLYP